ncbi:MAG: diaminobutyrate acetyltransferase [Alphaproteobacteria bacterium]
MPGTIAEDRQRLAHPQGWAQRDGVLLRRPLRADGAAIWKLVRDGGTLDLNSPYAYLLVATDFADTSLIAERGGEAVGFVAAYRPPPRPDTLFVWQVGVAPAARGQGLAGRMLAALADEAAGRRGVRWLEATVTPSNAASDALFRSFARRRGLACAVGDGFAAADFPDTDPKHEAERHYRIGPLKPA